MSTGNAALFAPWQGSSGVVLTPPIGTSPPPPSGNFGVPPAPVGAPKVLKSRGGGAADFGWEDEAAGSGAVADIGDVRLVFENQLI